MSTGEADFNNYFYHFYYITPKLLFLEERLTARFCPLPNFEIFPKLPNHSLTRHPVLLLVNQTCI